MPTLKTKDFQPVKSRKRGFPDESLETYILQSSEVEISGEREGSQSQLTNSRNRTNGIRSRNGPSREMRRIALSGAGK